MAEQQMSKKKKIFYAVILVAMVAGTGFLIYTNNASVPDIPDFQVPPSGVKTGVSADGGDISLEGVLQGLRRYGDWPVVLGEQGRSNPFLPVQ